MKIHQYLFQFIKDSFNIHKVLFIKTIIGISISKFAMTLMPFLFGKAVDFFSNGNRSSKILNNTHLPEFFNNNFNLLILGMILLWVIILLLVPVQTKFQSTLTQNLLFEKTLQWYNELLKKDFRFFTDKSSARVSNIVERGIHAHEKLFHHINDTMFPLIIELIFVSGFILYLGGLPSFIFSILFVFLQTALTTQLIINRRKLIDDVNLVEDEMTEESTELMRAGIVFQLNNAKNIILNRLRCVFRNYADKSISLSASGAYLSLVGPSFQNIATIGGLILGVFLTSKSAFSAGQAVALISLLVRFSSATGDAVGIFRFLDQFQLDVKELFALLKVSNHERQGKNINSVEKITIRAGQYAKGSLAIQLEENIILNKGEKIAVIGSSGGGKSALIELVAGLDLEARNQLEVNNIKLQNISSDSHTKLIRYCPQDPFIFPGNLIENLLVEKNTINNELLTKMHIDNLHNDRLDQLKQSNISGGEAKRVSIARAINKESEVYIFDEPTAGLNENLREIVWNTIFESSKNKILICVTHDEYILNKFDRVIKVEQGKVKELIACHL